ncbi:MAG TPA: transglutaminase family protein, partial [Verrucomicrobiaceae bacterium]
MSIHVALRHVTSYRYDRPVSLSPHVVRLRPAPHCRTRILSYALRVTPEKHFVNWQQDPQSNYLARLVFPEKTPELQVEVDLVAEMSVLNPFDFFVEPNAERFPFRYDSVLAHELEPFQRKLPLTPKFGDYLRGVRERWLRRNGGGSGPIRRESASGEPDGNGAGENGHGPARTIDLLVELNQQICSDVRYLIRMEPGVQAPDETLEAGSGSCRDSAWLLCQILRHLGLAARFVSGYLIQLKADVKALDGPSGAEHDFTDLHAWCEVYLPGAGWIGLDPTSGLMAGEGHLPLAATPDPQSAAPVSGAVEKCEVEFHHHMSVSRIYESPRVTKPYTDEQWKEIDALGRRIDGELESGDVRLTMGGEPTFVSIDDMDGPEWNLTAQGPTKRGLAGGLLKRLRQRFASGGLLFYGQGKWYPGESLPRWALGCYWRRDGVPVWNDEGLIADETRDGSLGVEDARRFGLTLAVALGVDSEWLVPGYEDVYYYLWKERRLPSNVDPLQSNLKDEAERARLAHIFQKGLGSVAGYLLPLKREWQGQKLCWQSGPWFLRDERLYLVPGDSPMGYRLPLDSLPWVAETDFPWIHPKDPMADFPPLPKRAESRQNFLHPVVEWLKDTKLSPTPFAGQGQPEPRGEKPPATPTAKKPAHGESASAIIRTALCFEPRHGRLHVFMPPVSETEDYLDLIAAIEDTAAALKVPVVIEGTPPPHDPRLNVIKVTPDPGVIEVNMHPARGWDELTRNTTILYEEARQSRLGTEKFMLDGRHTGTGGGNHIVIGGQSPSDSPILRRPDLLRSMLASWHNHPSLSYLFSGLFIGPTSQHPRVDEARQDALFELELAFKQLPESGSPPPWLADRTFRHILTDLTGNAHRAEFCIDKLYSPDASSTRLGLVELRSFEMPPHERMSLAQHLVLRAQIARFWSEPCTQSLARWGTALHDRFMLPHFVWEDFTDLLDELRHSGFPFKDAWFAPHFEFRFPAIGEVTQRGIHLELRNALEPWHVLGEEQGGSATVRFVDSSVERVQVRVRGHVDARYAITCNGRAIPLHPMGANGEYVAGVRYRAWQPPSCMHPNIGVHAPLVFDIIDTWNRRSLGGCTYHVMHPGGRSYETFPVNAWEAESRRLARFFRNSHTPGPVS